MFVWVNFNDSTTGVVFVELDMDAGSTTVKDVKSAIEFWGGIPVDRQTWYIDHLD